MDVESMLEEQLAAAQGPKLVVRKTFLDLQAGLVEGLVEGLVLLPTCAKHVAMPLVGRELLNE